MRAALERGRRMRVRFNHIQLGIKRAMVWCHVNDVTLEAVPDHIEDEPTWPETITPLARA